MSTVYAITEEDRERFREPRGTVVQDEELINELRERDYHRLICVGDRVSLDVADSGIDADIYVVDGHIERERIDTRKHDELGTDLEMNTENPAGVITEDAWNTMREATAHTCSTAVHVDGEEDLLALPAFLFASPDSLVVYGDWQNGAVIVEPDEKMKQFVRDTVGIPQHPHVIVGGSWDHFHAGHRYLLMAAFEHGRQVDIGVTTDRMLADLEKDTAGRLEDIETRKQHVELFLDTFGLLERAEVLEIDDFRGNAVDADRGVLLCTEETLENAKNVNAERLERQKTPLNIAVLDRITGEDGSDISSSRIRAGDIDKDGFILK